MATYSEKEEIKLEILPPYNIIQCRVALITLKDETEVGRTYSRTVYNPGDNLDSAPSEVQSCAAALWTDEIIQNYLASQTAGAEYPAAYVE